MRIEIVAFGKVIGTSELDRLDPSMRCALGVFIPTSDYMPDVHADRIEGDLSTKNTQVMLTARGPHGLVECSHVWIDDCSSELNVIEVTLLGIVDFDLSFSDHPDFKKYWSP